MSRRHVTRRRLLRSLGVGSAVALAGCGESGTGPAGGGTPSDAAASPTADPATTADPTPTDLPTTDPPCATTPSETATDEGAATTGTPIHPGYETTTVEATAPDGEVLGTVTAAIADTGDLRYTGLSDTESLPEDRGMLFVYDEVDDHTFVMRRMDFGIDIVYADADGTITSIHHALEPGPDEDGNEQRYPGRGQYVLEVNYGWTTDRCVGAGDMLEFDL